MAADGEIGGVSGWHYSFMGAQPNHEALSKAGEEVGRLLASGEVDVALDGAGLTYLFGRRWRPYQLHRACGRRHCLN